MRARVCVCSDTASENSSQSALNERNAPRTRSGTNRAKKEKSYHCT